MAHAWKRQRETLILEGRTRSSKVGTATRPRGHQNPRGWTWPRSQGIMPCCTGGNFQPPQETVAYPHQNFRVNDDIPSERWKEAAVQRLHPHKLGGHTNLRAEHFKKWIREAYPTEGTSTPPVRSGDRRWWRSLSSCGSMGISQGN